MYYMGILIFLLMAFASLASLSDEDFDEPTAAVQVLSAAMRK